MIDQVTLRLAVSIASGLFEAGKEIFELLQKEDLDEIQLLEIIDKAQDARSEARAKAYEALRQNKPR